MPAAILLDPSSRSVGPVFMSQMQGALIGAPLSTMQSILIVWPQTVTFLLDKPVKVDPSMIEQQLRNLPAFEAPPPLDLGPSR